MSGNAVLVFTDYIVLPHAEDVTFGPLSAVVIPDKQVYNDMVEYETQWLTRGEINAKRRAFRAASWMASHLFDTCVNAFVEMV